MPIFPDWSAIRRNLVRTAPAFSRQGAGRFTRLAVLALLLFASPAFAWQGETVRVADGDSLTVLHLGTGEQVRIRLYGVDCPENGQPYGNAARKATARHASARVLEITDMGRDRYKRTVAIVHLDGGTTLQEELLSSGLAWVEPRYCKKKKPCRAWLNLEHEARRDGRGLWPTPPWKWRKGQRPASAVEAEAGR